MAAIRAGAVTMAAAAAVMAAVRAVVRVAVQGVALAVVTAADPAAAARGAAAVAPVAALAAAMARVPVEVTAQVAAQVAALAAAMAVARQAALAMAGWVRVQNMRGAPASANGPARSPILRVGVTSLIPMPSARRLTSCPDAEQPSPRRSPFVGGGADGDG